MSLHNIHRFSIINLFLWHHSIGHNNSTYVIGRIFCISMTFNIENFVHPRSLMCINYPFVKFSKKRTAMQLTSAIRKARSAYMSCHSWFSKHRSKFKLLLSSLFYSSSGGPPSIKCHWMHHLVKALKLYTNIKS